MEELFTPVSTTYLKAKIEEPQLRESKSSQSETAQPVSISSLETLDDAIEVLKNEPDYDTLVKTLRYISTTPAAQVPSPQSAALIQTIITDIVPNYWPLLIEGSETTDTNEKQDINLLVNCLRNVTGLNALVANVKSLVEQTEQAKGPNQNSDTILHLVSFIQLTSVVLEGTASLWDICSVSINRLPEGQQRKLQTQTLVSLTAGGRVLSIVSAAIDKIGKEKVPNTCHWLADGPTYTQWVAQNVVTAIQANPDAKEFCFELVQRCMSLGYSDALVQFLIKELLLAPGASASDFVACCFLQPQRVKKILDILLNYLAREYLNQATETVDNVVSAAAQILTSVVAGDRFRQEHLVNWCVSSSGAGLGDVVGIRRAVLAVLSQNKDVIVNVFEKSLSQFGDELYIKHAAILQQEVHTEILLLSAGYVHRLAPIKLNMLMRSSTYLSTISNRIASTQPRLRLLGMAVGETLSSLKDGSETKLDFKLDEDESAEIASLKSLVHVVDKPGSIESITRPSGLTATPSTKSAQQSKPSKPQPTRSKPVSAATTNLPKAIIEEIDSSEDDEDLIPYPKGSDPEDSDEDATLVQRNKLKAPVYIRNLILYFRDLESYDKQKLALKTAPVLIRRKANYGTEVSSHADELATILVGLQDKFELEDFEEQKRQSIMALIVAQPKLMAPWFARSFFEGDFSLSQSTTILVSIGLAAREIAGYDVSIHQAATAFPSKQLPEKIESLYLTDMPSSTPDTLPNSQLKALPTNAIESISKDLVSNFLAPVAAEAADSQSGPDVLKLQTYKARYKNSSLTRPKVRAIPNTTASLLASYFFSPLTAHFQVALRSPRSVTLNPALLAIYLQTLGVIVHSAGPSTLSLPQLTSELWNLLLGVRVHAVEDLGALRGWLVAMAALLEVNGGDMRRLCETQSREIVETRDWVSRVFERIRGGDGGDENDVKMLAAGVLIRLGEAIEKYQALLMGDMIGYS